MCLFFSPRYKYAARWCSRLLHIQAGCITGLHLSWTWRIWFIGGGGRAARSAVSPLNRAAGCGAQTRREGGTTPPWPGSCSRRLCLRTFNMTTFFLLPCLQISLFYFYFLLFFWKQRHKRRYKPRGLGRGHPGWRDRATWTQRPVGAYSLICPFVFVYLRFTCAQSA